MESNLFQKRSNNLEVARNKVLLAGLLVLVSILVKKDSKQSFDFAVSKPLSSINKGELSEKPEKYTKQSQEDYFGEPSLQISTESNNSILKSEELPTETSGVQKEQSPFIDIQKQQQGNTTVIEDVSSGPPPEKMDIISLKENTSSLIDQLIIVLEEEKGITSEVGILSGILFKKLTKYQKDIVASLDDLPKKKEQYRNFIEIINYSQNNNPKLKEEHINTAIFLYALYKDGKLKDFFDFKKDVGIYKIAGIFSDKNISMNLYEKIEYLKRTRKDYLLTTPENTEALKFIFAKRIGGDFSLSTDDLVEIELIEMLCYQAKSLFEHENQNLSKTRKSVEKLRGLINRPNITEKVEKIRKEISKK